VQMNCYEATSNVRARRYAITTMASKSGTKLLVVLGKEDDPSGAWISNEGNNWCVDYGTDWYIQPDRRRLLAEEDQGGFGTLVIGDNGPLAILAQAGVRQQIFFMFETSHLNEEYIHVNCAFNRWEIIVGEREERTVMCEVKVSRGR